MSVHRRVCISEAPGIIGPALDGHTHACLHDAEPVLDAAPLLHQCGCGMTWTGISAVQASAMDGPAAATTAKPKEPVTCPAHGGSRCDLCALNSAGPVCDQCTYYEFSGMHWDTCARRIRTYAEAAAYFGRLAGPVQVAPNAAVSRLELANRLNRYINATVERVEASGRSPDWAAIHGMRLSADWVAGLIGDKDDRVITEVTDGGGP